MDQTRTKPLILIVDDEKDVLEIFGAKLKAAGFDVAGARNGKDGIEQTKKLVPDLILMDIHMPDMTGTEAALTLKQDQKTKDVKIAFLTSLKNPWPALTGDKGDISRELGMEDFLEKTDNLDSIVLKVREILNRK